jgi:hypothetical protein
MIGDEAIAAPSGLAALALRTLRLQLDTFHVDDLQPLARSRTLPPAIVRYVRAVIEQRRKQR